MDKLLPSQTPPGGLKPHNVPQFVSIGFDDNGATNELEWILDLSNKLKNNNDSSVVFTFYNNGSFKNATNLWKKLYLDGHEIGDHTFSHPHGKETFWDTNPPSCRVLMSKADWKKEMDKNKQSLIDAGIKPEDIKGFRTPFLEYTDFTYEAIRDSGYLYDCSVEEGHEEGHRPGNYFWPYTLDNGAPGDKILAKDVEGRNEIGSFPGLWEMPVYLLEIPADDLANTYNFPLDLGIK
jgi:peptidoglycan/xylan/chitin deacetylase (PgdA/CDA1 family)